MANTTTLSAEIRERAGTGGARATRREGKVPGVIYGAKATPELIALDPRDVVRELHRGGWQSRLFEVSVGGSTTRALIREVQFHPVSDKPIHVDFQRLAPGQRIRVAVAVQFQNEGISPGLKRGGVLNVVRHTVEVFADAEHIPEHFVADLSTLNINDNVRWTDLKGTEGTKPVISDRDFVVCTVAPPTKMTEAAVEAVAVAAAPVAPAAAPAPAKAAPAKAPARGAKK